MCQAHGGVVPSTTGIGSSQEPEAMHLLRRLSFLEAKHPFYIFTTHIRGVFNILTDALSRNKQTLFYPLYLQAKKEPVEIPASLLDLLVLLKPDWTSQSWMQQWSSSSVMV